MTNETKKYNNGDLKTFIFFDSCLLTSQGFDDILLLLLLSVDF